MKHAVLIILSAALAGCITNTPKEDLSVSFLASSPKECRNFLGKWTSETLNPRFNFINVHTAEYKDDGSLYLHFIELDADRNELDSYKTVRRWDCDGILYVTKNVEDGDIDPGLPQFKVYKLLELTKSRIKYQTLIGHTPGNTFELNREPESHYK